MKNLQYILILSLTCLYLSTYAQKVLMDKTVDPKYKISKFGTNRTHFLQPYISFGFIVGDTDQKDVKTKFGSNMFSIGLRYKLRLNNTFSTGLETAFGVRSIFYPTRKPILKDHIQISEWRNVWYFRTNFGKRGNYIGKGLDLGVFTSMKIFSTNYLKMKSDNPDYRNIKIYNNGLNYLEPFYYGFFGRIFYSKFAIFVEYRYSDILKESDFNKYNNIPPLTIGIEIGIR